MTTKQLKSYLLAMLSALVLPNLYAAPSDGPYVLDEQRFYVAGQPVTDAIETANRLMCYLANMRPDAFVSDGAYQAKVYEERCISSGADATSEAASASVKSSQSAASANSSKAAADLETETALTATLIVEPLAAAPDDAFAVQPMKVTGWVDLLAQDEQDIDTRVYLGAEIADHLFKTANANARYMFDSMKLEANTDLSEAEKKQQQAQIIERHAEKSINVNNWNDRFQAFSGDKQNILNSSISDDEKRDQLTALMHQHFNYEELDYVHHLKLDSL